MPKKEVIWLHGEVEEPPFSREAMEEAMYLLARLRRGEKLSLPQSRPMPSIGSGCHELRVKDETVDWRIAYLVQEDAIVVLEVWKKKTRKTPLKVIKNCQKRVKQYCGSH